jgi:redox-sensitive bicupin YhaK (pirin superfamily)
MIAVRKSEERGHVHRGWLDSRFTFSFADYYDPQHMGFSDLRVINDDWIGAGSGFGTHPHRDMEILTWVLEGELEHRDTLGSGSVLGPGKLQRMSAGRGIAHSEFNHSQTEKLHLLQIWILPERAGLEPGYEEKVFPANDGMQLLASRDGRDGGATIHQDVEVWLARLDGGQAATHEVRPGRRAWVHVAKGSVTLNDRPLSAGDGAAVDGETRLDLTGGEAAEVLIFDLR